MKKKIILISGDPNSINSEIIFKSWKRLNSSIRKQIFLISNYELLRSQFKKLKYPMKLVKIKNIDEEISSGLLKILDINLKFKNPFKVNLKSSSEFVTKSLSYGHQLALRNDVKGLINCPIDKKLLKNKFIGVTEYLASKCKIKKNSEVMLIFNNKLSVSPITTHINIKQISRKLSKKIIVDKILIIDEWFKKIFSKKPKFGILGLNPHNAELFRGSEEKEIIIPSIIKLKSLGLNIQGPLVGDTLFIKDFKNYDVVVGMYHDQVLIPFKTLFKFDAINTTLGLQYLRTSPDHGTATNLIGKKKADANSLINCIYFVNKFGK